ncbi:unnamed protein product, partial [Meganyctiphanes norvegica]
MSCSKNILQSMQNVFQTYSKMLQNSNGTKIENIDKPVYWDLVVLTTFDDVQKACFEQQINEKRASGQLPEVCIQVISDPPKEKLGCGGSTLHVLQILLKQYEDKLYDKRILIIHSGGSSQRLPSYSVIGKIFSPVPVKNLAVGNSIPQMLDLKLAKYLEFAELLRPGVFVTCADDIETYSLNLKDSSGLQSADVVALAHPSPIEIGEGHGVYVISSPQKSSSFARCSTVEDVQEVLQKPNMETMRSKGAVIKSVAENGAVEEQIFSDSVFWLSHKVCQALLMWYADNNPLDSELDAYAHFLPCFGTRMKDVKPENYKDYRSQMLPILSGFKMKVILLNESNFYHIGTMKEYLQHFCEMESFNKELGLINNTSNIDNPFKNGHRYESEMSLGKVKGVVIQSHFYNSCIVSAPEDCKVLLEYCQIGVPISVQGDIILSNCIIQECPTVKIFGCINLFDNLLYHTSPIHQNERKSYVTVAFDLDSDMKRKTHCYSELVLFGKPLSHLLDISGYTERNITSGVEHGGMVSLWTVKIFPKGNSAAESFWLTHHLVSNSKQHGNRAQQIEISVCNESLFYSMSDVVELKDIDTLIKDRNDLNDL